MNHKKNGKTQQTQKGTTHQKRNPLKIPRKNAKPRKESDGKAEERENTPSEQRLVLVLVLGCFRRRLSILNNWRGQMRIEEGNLGGPYTTWRMDN